MARLTRLLAPTIAAVLSTIAIAEAFNLVVAHTQRGLTYKVNQAHSHQLIGFVNDLEKHYGPIRHIGCYSQFGHVYMSQHHVGNACDIEQHGWGRTSYLAMYHVGWLTHKWVLRDGCSFRDCGHVDAGGPGWVNGAPPGRIARAEIPADASVKQASMQLAGVEKPVVKKPLHRDPRWHDDRGGIIRLTYDKRQLQIDAMDDRERLLPGAKRRAG